MTAFRFVEQNVRVLIVMGGLITDFRSLITRHWGCRALGKNRDVCPLRGYIYGTLRKASMNAKKLIVFTVALGLFAVSSANVYAQMHGHAGVAPSVSTSHSFVGPATGTWHGGNWGGGNWGGNWHHHNHCGGSAVFIGGFGFPFWGFGYPYYGFGYPYGGYYPYYGGGYYGGGYYGGGPYYNSGNYGGGYYGARSYSTPVYASYAYGSCHQSSVARLQRRLAQSGYYRGPIDGIMGSRTHYALRAYQHDHGAGTYGMTNQ